MTSTQNVWEARGVDDIRANTFNIIMAVTTIYGLFVFGLLSGENLHSIFGFWASLALILGSFLGLFISAMSNPAAKLLGLTTTAACLGAFVGPMIGQYKIASVTDIAFATAFVTLILGAAGSLYPKSLANWGSLLFMALGALIVCQFLEIIAALFGFHLAGLHTFFDWAGVVIFSGYIVFDFNRAQHVPKTAENAFQVGVSIFLDIINLFIRLLELFGVKAGSWSDD